MKHICFFGNSHLAAIKLGWDRIHNEFPDVTAVFFGARDPLLSLLEEKDGKLIAVDPELRDGMISTSANKYEIDVSGFDRFVIVGLGLNVLKLAEMSQLFRVESQDWADDAPYLVSESCYFDACVGILKDAAAFKLSQRIAEISGRPVTILPQPMLSETAMERSARPRLRHIIASGGDRALAEHYGRCLSGLSNASCKIVMQPAITLAGPLLTKGAYSQGSMRLYGDLGRAHPQEDVSHMNPEYGALALREVLPAFRDQVSPVAA